MDNEEFFKYQKSINILMHTILSPVTLCHKLITEEWKQLFALMDILYGNALKIWLAKHDCLSEEEIALCYFCYIGVRSYFESNEHRRGTFESRRKYAYE